MIPLLYSNTSDTSTGEVFLESVNHSRVFCSQFENGSWYCYILLVLFSVTLPVGILGNVAAVISYVCVRRTWSPSHVFLLNLALCDSVWVLTLPFTLYVAFRKLCLRQVELFCQFKRVSFNVSVYGSIFFLALVSFDRYVGAVHPISSLNWWDVDKAKFCSGCIWVLLALCSIPDLFVTFAVRRPENGTVCMDHISGPLTYIKTVTVIRTTVGFLLPFGAMLTFYVLTVRVLRRLPRGGRPAAKPLRLITAALLVFVVSFLPYHIMISTLVLMRIHKQVTTQNSNVLYASYEFFEAVCSVSSCLDPLLYIMASKRFQKTLLALKNERRLCCRTSRRVGTMG